MIEQKIKQVVDKINGLSYMFNDWTIANIEFDTEKTQFPICLNVLPVSGELSVKNGNYRDRPHCMIAFLDLIPDTDSEGNLITPSDTDGNDTEPIIERMKTFAKHFIHEVNQSGLFEQVGDLIPYSVIYDKLDTGVTGICIQIQLKELAGDCL